MREEYTIFRPANSMKEKSERHRVIHFVWKTKIFLPLIQFLSKHTKRFMINSINDIPKDKEKPKRRYRVIKWIWKTPLTILMVWILNKKIKKFTINSMDDIPSRTHNRNFRILYYSFEKGVEDWFFNFYGGIRNGVKDKTKYKELEERFKTKETCHWYKLPKFFINLLITICLEDTAYRELINCVMMRLQGEMNRNWNPEIKHRFPMYISMHDGLLPFFFEWMRIDGGGMLQIDKDPLEVKFQTSETKKVELNKEAVEMIEKLSEGDRQRFKLQLNKFILKLLGQERRRLCVGCGKVKPLDEFKRSGTANIEFLICSKCAYLKQGENPRGTAEVRK